MGSADTLWTPDRNIPLNTRTIQYATEEEMRIFQALDLLARKFKLVLLCPHCDKSFTGENTGNGRQAGIHCGCREIRADYGRRLV